MSADALITGVGVWTPGIASADAWSRRAFDPAVERPIGAYLRPRSRRRASTLTRGLAEVFREALAQAGEEPGATAGLFGSSVGEASAMIHLLDQMWRQPEDLSPAIFATSVHNAASGQISIEASNRGFTTSLAADYDTPAMALLEAMALLATGAEAVVIACGDEASPPGFVPDGEEYELLCCAVVMVPVAAARPGLARVRGPDRAVPTLQPCDARPALARNPQVGMLDLIDAVQRGAPGTIGLDRGRGSGWGVTIDPSAAQDRRR